MIKKFASVIWVATCAALIITLVPLSKVEKAFATIRLASSDAAMANQPGHNALAKISRSGFLMPLVRTYMENTWCE